MKNNPYISLHACPLVGCVELHQPPVLAAAGHDAAVLHHADAEDGALVDLKEKGFSSRTVITLKSSRFPYLSERLCDRVVSPAPDEHVPVGVARQDVAGEGERQAGHVLGLVAL